MSMDFFKDDIIIDDVAFETASKDFSNLVSDIENLKNSVNKMLTELKTGFDTPAGRKFISACENKLIKPIEKQEDVIKHVSENLEYAKNEYNSVFDEYSNLNRNIENIKY